MLRNGPTFFPTTYGKPYPDYPATGTLMIYLASLPGGHVTPFTAAIPTAIVSALILVLIFRIGAIHSLEWGLIGVGFILLTKTFVSLSRCVSPDQFVSLAAALGFYIIYTADVFDKKRRLFWIPLIFVGGFLFRGPLGLIIPAAVVCTYYLVDKKIKFFSLMSFVALLVMILCCAGLLAAARYQGGDIFMHDVIRMQAIGRLYEKSHGFLYYFTEGLNQYALCYPVALIVLIIFWKKIWEYERDEYRLLAKLAIWAFIVIIGLSFASTKKERYILPAMPALALISGWLIYGAKDEIRALKLKRGFLKLCKYFPALACLCVVAIGYFNLLKSDVDWHTASILTGIIAIVVWAADRRLKGSLNELLKIGAGALTLLILITNISEPYAVNTRGNRPFVEKISSMQKKSPANIVFYQLRRDKEALSLLAIYEEPVEPLFIYKAGEITSCPGGSYIIATEEAFKQLPEKVKTLVTTAYKGKFYKEDCLVLIRKLQE
ncbi:MAG: glycosyltransferase family 39 protein [Proteobacteria bacterium]|nr:glycosyltransferase family 39 protein [Pseudomonadota bacterium]